MEKRAFRKRSLNLATDLSDRLVMDERVPSGSLIWISLDASVSMNLTDVCIYTAITSVVLEFLQSFTDLSVFAELIWEIHKKRLSQKGPGILLAVLARKGLLWL